MPRENSGYINVDQLMPQVSLERAAAYYGVALPDLHRAGTEIRMRCFLACGKAGETGDRALAINAESSVMQWKCHSYGCGKGGNLVSLCDLMKPGPSMCGRPRGERFKAIARDLQAMAGGPVSDAMQTARRLSPPPPVAPAPRPVNVPLARSDNERARGLTTLDEKFLTDPAVMPPAAASYFRRRPFLLSEVCRKWRVGYLPRDTGGDKSGGTMRGKIVYAYLSETGELLTWFGRDPEYEEKYHRWLAGGKVDREPNKFHFVSGYSRGLEMYGQHASRLSEPGVREAVARLGIVVVEGPNDVIALDRLGVPAVALCSNTITAEQCEKIAAWASRLSGSNVTLMLDCDPEGENGARQVLFELAQCCRVRIAWNSTMFGGRFKGRQPESLSADEWEQIVGQ